MRFRFAVAVLAALAVLGVAARAGRAQEAERGGWTIPPEAKQERNPIAVTPQVLAAGRALYEKNCERCHGPKGVGDGPDADPEHMAEMDLTNPRRAARNPDGVVFYKIWNGRRKPKMPAFRTELTREQVWTLVAYVQTLRKPAASQ